MSDGGEFDHIEDGSDQDAVIREHRARERAREAALAPGEKPRRRTTSHSTSNYVQAALDAEVTELRNTFEGSRNHQLNAAAFALGQLVNPTGSDAKLSVAEIESALLEACRDNGLLRDDGIGQCRKTIRSGLESGQTQPRDLTDVAVSSTPDDDDRPRKRKNTGRRSEDRDDDSGGGVDDEPDVPSVVGRRLSTFKSKVPQWVWEYDGAGRIQLATFTVFAGRPAAGKSTAARYFAAQITNGELPGCWYGHPMNVAMVSLEEGTEDMVMPSLEIAGADLNRVIQPEFRDPHTGHPRGMSSIRDEHELRDMLLEHEVRALFVDPVMSTFGGKADINRNNEVREWLAPYIRIAKAINGIVVGVTHLRKGNVTDIMEAINGSSAFGELPRCIFGFAGIDADEPQHIMEQVKNSAGPMGLKLNYHLPIERQPDSDGLMFELPRFEIIGPSTVSIADLGDVRDSGEDLPLLTVAMQWLEDYLSVNQPAPSKEVKEAARKADISERTLQRARKRLRVNVSTETIYRDGGAPRVTVWSLPMDMPR